MKVSVEGPTEFVGAVFGSINQRRGVIVSSVEDGTFSRVDAEVPLSEMFGYSTVLRSLTQGKAEFTMEFLKYGKVPGLRRRGAHGRAPGEAEEGPRSKRQELPS